MNLKLHNFSVTPKMVKKTITNFDLTKASGVDVIPVMVLKNCEPELSYILAELFNMCLKELGKGLQLKTIILLVLFLWLVVFKKLANDRIVDHLEKCGLFF